MKKMINTLAATAALTFAEVAFAGPSLPSGGGSAFSLFRTWLQDLIDFMAGPYATATLIFTVIAGLAAWNYAPKEGLMGYVVRGIVTGVVCLNIGTWIAAMNGGSTISI